MKTGGAYDDGMSWEEDGYYKQLSCEFVRISPLGQLLPHGHPHLDISGGPGTVAPWKEMHKGAFHGKRLGLLRECREYAGRPDFERALMSQLMWAARMRLRHGGCLHFCQQLLRNQPEHFALISWPSLAAFKASTRAEEATNHMHIQVMTMPYRLSQSDLAATREDPLSAFKLPPRTPHHFLVVFRIRHGRDKSVCAEWLFQLPFPTASPAPMVADPALKRPFPLPPFAQMLNEDEGRLRMLEGKCSHCGRTDGKRYLCTACGHHSFCSKECQVADWKQHKRLCRLQRQAIEAGTNGIAEIPTHQ